MSFRRGTRRDESRYSYPVGNDNGIYEPRSLEVHRVEPKSLFEMKINGINGYLKRLIRLGHFEEDHRDSVKGNLRLALESLERDPKQAIHWLNSINEYLKRLVRYGKMEENHRLAVKSMLSEAADYAGEM